MPSSVNSSSFLSAPSHGDSSLLMQRRHSLDMCKEKKSPVTSTPLRHHDRSSSPGDRSFLAKSPVLGDEPNSEIQKQDDSFRIRKNSDSRNKSGGRNRRRSKKMILSPLVGTPTKQQTDHSLSNSSDFNSNASIYATPGERSLEDIKSHFQVSGKSHSSILGNYENDVDTSLNSRASSDSSLVSCGHQNSSSLHIDKTDTRKGEPPRSNSFNQIANTLSASTGVAESLGLSNNVAKSLSWSQIASNCRGPSPVPSMNSVLQEGPLPGHKLSERSSLTVEMRPSSPSWSHIMKTSPSSSPVGTTYSSEKGKQKWNPAHGSPPNNYHNNNCKNGLSGLPASNRLPASNPSLSGNNSRPSSSSAGQIACQKNQLTPARKGPKGIIYGKERRNSLDNGGKRFEDSDSTIQTSEAQKNVSSNKAGGKKGNEKQRAKLMTLDNFMTPEKNKENWPNLGTKGLNAFENRFVEHIDVSSTSPPKKVRPSPIKKLNFSFQGDLNSSSESDTSKVEINSSITSESDAPNGVKPHVVRRQVSLIRELGGGSDLPQTQKAPKKSKASLRNSHNHTQSPRNSGLIFCLEDYMKSKDCCKKDIISVEPEDILWEGKVNDAKVKEFWTPKPVADVNPCPLKRQ